MTKNSSEKGGIYGKMGDKSHFSNLKALIMIIIFFAACMIRALND